MRNNHHIRMKKAVLSLEGLSIGDAFGQKLAFTSNIMSFVTSRTLPDAPWAWTDDTHMTLSVVAQLRKEHEIKQDQLADAFARRFIEEPERGYAAGAARLLTAVGQGDSWREMAASLFPGGSYGNGAAMRAAPIGGYFYDDPAHACAQARLAAEITHAHPEGQAGAIAVAAAASIAASGNAPQGNAFLETILPFIPESDVKSGIRHSLKIESDDWITAVQILGTGNEVTAQDTVPYCLWQAAHRLTRYKDALWATVMGMGDLDTTCAIVGGIVALACNDVPPSWQKRRERLPLF